MNRGILYAIVNTLFFSCVNPLVKYLFVYNPNISPFEVAYGRGLIMVVLNYLLMKPTGGHPLDIPKNYRKTMIVRSAAGMASL